MRSNIKGYIIGSDVELDRIDNINMVKRILPSIQFEQAVYPEFNKVPFAVRLRKLSLQRTGHQLSNGELGCVLSHRKVWRKIVATAASDDEMFLILESDSFIENVEVVSSHFEHISQQFDLFFWGAWEGHMKLFRSTRQPMAGNYSYGTPFIKTVYCTYGYSLNRKAAALLLKRTAKIGYSVDQFKRFINNSDLKVGGVDLELIRTIGKTKSYIQQYRNKFKESVIFLILDIRNSIICWFK